MKHVTSTLNGSAMAQAVCGRPSLRQSMFDPRSDYVRFVGDKMTLRQVFLPVLRFSLVHITPLMPHTDLHLRAAVTRRTKRAKPGNLQKSNALSEIREQWIAKYFHFVFKGSSKHHFTMANNINVKTQKLGS